MARRASTPIPVRWRRTSRYPRHRLDVGDVQLDAPPPHAAHTVLVERKTWADFAKSLTDGRFGEQKARLCAVAAAAPRDVIDVVEYGIEGVPITQHLVADVHELAAEGAAVRRFAALDQLTEGGLGRVTCRVQGPGRELGDVVPAAADACKRRRLCGAGLAHCRAGTSLCR